MEPALRDGEPVVVDLCDGRAARVGDVVLVLDREGRTVLHRVVARDAATLTTRGDAQLSDDVPVPHARILGRARVPRRNRARVTLARWLGR